MSPSTTELTIHYKDVDTDKLSAGGVGGGYDISRAFQSWADEGSKSARPNLALTTLLYAGVC